MGGEAVSAVNLLDPPDTVAIDKGLRLYADVAKQRYRAGLKGVYLFGSRARGDFSPFSDVDVAIVVSDEIDISSETVPLSSAAYDVLLETGAEVQPWVFHETDWDHPERSFARSLIRSAKREARRAANLDSGMSTYRERAEQAAHSARRNRDHGDFNDACNRAYYAMFYAIHALFAGTGDDLIVKTHASVLRLFHQHFVATGKLSSDLARALTVAQNFRSRADYTETGASERDAADAISAMETFLTHVGALLSAGAKEDSP